MAKVLIKPDTNGNLAIPRDALGEDAKDVVYSVEREGNTIRLEAKRQKLHDIEDPQERAEAVERFLKRIAQPTGVRWSEDHNFRDDIYD